MPLPLSGRDGRAVLPGRPTHRPLRPDGDARGRTGGRREVGLAALGPAGAAGKDAVDGWPGLRQRGAGGARGLGGGG